MDLLQVSVDISVQECEENSRPTIYHTLLFRSVRSTHNDYPFIDKDFQPWMWERARSLMIHDILIGFRS